MNTAPSSQPEHSLVLTLVMAIGQAIEGKAEQTARRLAEALGAALVESGRVSEVLAVSAYSPFVAAKANWKCTEELSWILWDSTHRHLRSKKEGIYGCGSGACRNS